MARTRVNPAIQPDAVDSDDLLFTSKDPHDADLHSDLQMAPVKFYMENFEETKKKHYLPNSIFVKLDDGHKMLQIVKQNAKNAYTNYCINPTSANRETFIRAQENLARTRGTLISRMPDPRTTDMIYWRRKDRSIKSDELLFEFEYCESTTGDKQLQFKLPTRYVVRQNSIDIFKKTNGNKAMFKNSIVEFLTLAKIPNGILIESEPAQNFFNNILEDIKEKFELDPDNFKPRIFQTDPTLDAKYTNKNDIGSAGIQNGESFVSDFEQYKYNGLFSTNAPRFSVNQAYMHAGVLERANQVIKQAFRDNPFSIELKLEIEHLETNSKFEVKWTACRYDTAKVNLYEIKLETGQRQDFSEDLEQIMQTPPSDISVTTMLTQQTDLKKVENLSEVELLRIHQLSHNPKEMLVLNEIITYMYYYNYWTIIISFIPKNTRERKTYIEITIFHRIGEIVQDNRKSVSVARADTQDQRLIQMHEINTVVLGQNVLLRQLIQEVSTGIGRLPIKMSELPQGHPDKWLIFGTEITDSMQDDYTLEVEGLTPDLREAMERKSNMIKAEILQIYFKNAIDISDTTIGPSNKKSTVFDFLYATDEMKEYIQIHGYTRFEKICPGVFVLAIRAFPQGYHVADVFDVDATEYWKTSIEAMLGEFGVASNRFRTKIGEAFDPKVQFYIDSVLAHQNKKKRKQKPPIDTSASVLYQFNHNRPAGTQSANPFSYDAPSRRGVGMAAQRRGHTQSRFEILPDQPNPSQSLQEDVDVLRRTVNQLALMGE